MDYLIFGITFYILTIELINSQESYFQRRLVNLATQQYGQDHIHHHTNKYHNVMNRDVGDKIDNIAFRERDNTVKYVPSEPDLNSRTNIQECVAGLCSGVDDYPAEKIKSLLEANDAYHAYFNATKVELNNRFSPALDKDEESLCKATTRTIFPEKAKNTEDKEKYIVNVGDYRQGIEFDECGPEGRDPQYIEDPSL